jgi:GAF domain-containing protein
MRKRRVVLFFILIVVLSFASLIQLYRFNTSLAAERASAAALDRDFATLRVALSDLRAAQAGYVATGQGSSAWMVKSAELAANVSAGLEALHPRVSSTAAPHVDAAATAFEEWTNLDARARGYVTTDRRFEASDLIFVDAAASAQRANDAVVAAQSAEQQASAGRVASTTRWQLGLAAGAIAVLLLIAIGSSRTRGDAGSKDPALHREPQARGDAGSRDPALHHVGWSPGASAPGSVAPAPSEISLADAADLCVDLGKVLDGREVPALLERAASVLGASGVVLWVADSAGAMLRPSLTHGYPEKILARLGSLQVDGDNATSLAYRSMRAQVIRAAPPNTRGAIAVPLVTSSGCVGVLAAEVPRARPAQDTLAVARMISAQLAALVVPSDPASVRVG